MAVITKAIKSYWPRIVAGIAALVVFSTVYTLILPAAAITGEEAAEESGFFTEAEDHEASGSEEYNLTVAETETGDPNGNAESSDSTEGEEQTLGEEISDGAGLDSSEAETVENIDAAEEPQKNDPSQEVNQQTEQTSEVVGGTTAEETSEAPDGSTDSSSLQETVETGEDDSAENADNSSSEEATEEALEEESEEDESEEIVYSSGKLFFRGNNFFVTIEYDADAKIPDTAKLLVRELDADSEEYKTHLETAENNAAENDAQVCSARFFDITIVDSDYEIEPAAAVKVSIAFDKEELEVSQENEIEVLHYSDEENAETVGTVEVESSSVGDMEKIEGVEFDTDAFSVFGVLELKTTDSSEPMKPIRLTAVRGGTQGSIFSGDINEANAWQIVEEGYEGNTETYKTVISDDGMARIQKNVISTGVENEFLVYLSMDTLSRRVLTVTEFSEFISDLSWYTGQAANQSVGDNGDLVGTGIKEKALGPSNNEGFVLTLRYNGQILATATLGLSVPNSAVFIRVAGGQYIQIAHVFKNARPGQEGYYPKNSDGYYIVDVDLTERAYRALLTTVTDEVTTTETIIGLDGTGDAYVIDDMGPYIVYDGTQDVNGTVSSTQTGIKWTLSGKSDPLTSDPVTTTETEGEGTDTVVTTTTTTWWNYNVAELLYKAHLDVTKDGFASGTEYDVNNSAVLKYIGTDGQEHSVTFQEPTVKGTLYDFELEKVDESGKTLPDAKFTLTGPRSNPDVTTDSISKTAFSGSDGKVQFGDLPWGTYTLKETDPPSGYSLPSSNEWTLDIGYTSWPDKIDHKEAANDDYALSADWKVVNKKNTITVKKSVVPYGEIELSEIDHTVYFALWDRTNSTYLKDSTGNIIYESVVITAGVPDPETVTFEGVPTGEYSVWELSGAPGSTDVSAEAIVAPAVIKTLADGTEIEIKSVVTSGVADLSGRNTAEVTVTNTYAHHNGKRDVTVKKSWALNDGTPINAPANTTVIFTLYRIANGGQPETVGTIELNGEADQSGEYESWGAKWEELPTMNDDGYTYTYMVRETSCTDPDYSAYIGQYNTEPMGSSTYQTNVSGGTIWNKRQSTEIPVTKEVTGISTDLTKEFSFTATLPEGTVFPDQSQEGVAVSGNTATFRLKNGDIIVLSGIPIGVEMTVKEELQSDENGIYTTEASGRTGGVFNNSTNAYTFDVIQEEGTVLFNNVRNKGVIRITKNVTGDEPYGLTSREFEFKITGPSYPDGTTVKVKVQKSGDTWTGYTDIPDLYVGDYTVSEVADSATFAGYTWTVSPESGSTEEGDTDAATQTVAVAATDTAANPAPVAVTNNYEQNKSDIVFYKVWDDEEDELNLRWSMDGFKRALTLDNGVENAAVPQSAVPEIAVDSTDSNKWVITYKDMPTHVNGVEATYTLKETPIQYYQTEGSPASAEGTITNSLDKSDLTLLKVDSEETTITLPGAKFKLLRSSEENDEPVLYTLDFEDGIYTTDDDGTISFSLPDGYYTLTEVQAPTGYIFDTGDYTFTIEVGIVSGDQVTLSGEDVDPEGDNKFIITIPNTPGEALPSTGGPGTRLFSILGGILIAMTGVLLVRRRKLQ